MRAAMARSLARRPEDEVRTRTFPSPPTADDKMHLAVRLYPYRFKLQRLAFDSFTQKAVSGILVFRTLRNINHRAIGMPRVHESV